MRDIKDYTENYQKLPFEKYQVQYRRKKVVELLNQFKHDSILEVGCGLEPLFQYYEDYEYMTIVEPSEVFCDNAVKLSDKFNKGAHIFIVRGNVEDKIEELKVRSYDYIVISSLLHELEEPYSVLGQISRICTENTVVHVNVPNAYSFHRILAYESGMISDIHMKSEQQRQMQQNSTFDLQSITDLAEKADFKVLSRGTYFPKLFTHAQMQKMLDLHIINEEILNGLYQMGKYFPEYGSELFVQLQKNV